MAEQALQNSVDVEEIKKFRQTVRTQVTNSVSRLGNLLDNNGIFFYHKVISEIKVELVETELREAFKRKKRKYIGILPIGGTPPHSGPKSWCTVP